MKIEFYDLQDRWIGKEKSEFFRDLRDSIPFSRNPTNTWKKPIRPFECHHVGSLTENTIFLAFSQTIHLKRSKKETAIKLLTQHLSTDK